MPPRKVRFANDQGQTLVGRLDMPAGKEPAAFALFAHCFTCSKDLQAAASISRALTSQGYAVLRFDFTGLGESEGDFGDTNFSSNVGDLVAAARFLEAQFQAPRILVGHSFGGAGVVHAAARLPSVAAVATIGAPASPAHVQHLLTSSEAEIRASGEATVAIAGRPFTIKRQFLEDLEEANMAAVLRDLGRPLAVLHSPVDGIVGIENAALIFDAARHPKSFVSLDRADHLLTNRRDATYAGLVLAAWAWRYLADPATGTEAVAAESAVVARIGRRRYLTEITAGNHSLLADEPEAAGGGDMGAGPYDLVMAGLGACTAITLRMYADRKGWPLEAVTVQLHHDKVHATDSALCPRTPCRLDRFERVIALAGDLDDAQRSRLLDIADKCPVHRTLESKVVSETRLAP